MSNMVILNWTAELEEGWHTNKYGDMNENHSIVIRVGGAEVARKSGVYVDIYGDPTDDINDIAGSMISNLFAKLNEDEDD